MLVILVSISDFCKAACGGLRSSIGWAKEESARGIANWFQRFSAEAETSQSVKL